MEPINYSIDVKSPFESAVSGYQTVLGMRQASYALAEKERQIAVQSQMQADLGALASKQNPSAQDFAQITIKYPQLAEHFKNTWSMMNSDQQQSRLQQASQVYAALQSGKPEIAKQLLDTQAAALRNSGNDQDAGHAETMRKLIDSSPETAMNSAGLLLSSILGPEKFATTFSSLSKLPGEVSKGEADAMKASYEANNTPERLALENRFKASEIRNLDSQIGERAQRLGLDRDKLQTETELKLHELNQKAGTLDDGARKLINDSTVASVAADQSAGQMLDLANRLEKAGGGYGAFSSASEWLKSATGNQDAMSQMRQEYTRLRNNHAIKMLPPGPATDKDIQIAMKGFPADNADVGTMASFLRGMAKLNQLSAVTDNAKAEWVNAVGHLGKPKTDISIDGIAVPAGSTFTDFARQYMASKADRRAVEQSQQQVQGRSYMRWANPGAK